VDDVHVLARCERHLSHQCRTKYRSFLICLTHGKTNDVALTKKLSIRSALVFRFQSHYFRSEGLFNIIILNTLLEKRMSFVLKVEGDEVWV